MISRYPKLMIALVAILLASAGAGGWVFLNSENAAQPWLAQIMPSVFGDDRSQVVLLGNVDVRQINLAFKVGGRVSEMEFEEGDAVEAGQVVAALERGEFEDEVRLAQAQTEARAAALAELENGTRPEEIAQARALVAQYEAEAENARLVFSRRDALAERGFAPHEAHEDARAAMRQAEARLEAAQEALKLAEAGPRGETIQAARAELRASEVALDLAKRKHNDAELVAPSTGIIQTRIREPGAIVGPGETIYKLTLTTPVWIRTFVEEPDLGRIHPGMAAEVTTDSGGRYQGQIGFISPMAEFTPKTVETRELRTSLVYRLRVIVKEPDDGLRQGMPVTVVLRPDQAPQTAELRHD